MSGGSMKDGFSGVGGSGGAGWPVNGIWEAMDQLRGMFEQKVAAPRMARGDVRAAVLALLAEQPMHGYQIIQQIDERSGGSWKPSPGSVYPTLQLLADEGLVKAEESGDRKVYTLTEAGSAVAAESAEGTLPWDARVKRDSERATALPKAGAKLAQAIVQVSHSASAEQAERAVALLDETRRKLYAILAED